MIMRVGLQVSGLQKLQKNEVPAGLGTTLTTADDGTVTVKGLKAGDYYFKEVVAPDGYSINNNDTAFTMEEKLTNGAVTSVAAANPELIKMYDSKLPSFHLPVVWVLHSSQSQVVQSWIAAAGFFLLAAKE